MHPVMQRAVDIKAYQANPYVHPLTCGNNSSHRHLMPHLEWLVTQDYRLTLMCRDCGYIQTFIPDIDYATLATYNPFS